MTEAVMKTSNPEEVRKCCPQCGDDKFHLYFNLKKRVWHCFKCGARGREEPERLYSEEALEEMIEIMKGTKRPEESKKVLVLPECREPGDDVETRATQKYLKERGFLRGITRNGFLIPMEVTYENRFLVPIYDPSGNHISFFQARGYFRFVRPKYINPIYPKSGTLFYGGGRRFDSVDHLFITEGIFKALQFGKIGEESCAILGKEISREQIRLIWERTRHVTIVLDPDAFTFAIKMADEMSVFAPKKSTIQILHPHKAPDDMTRRELMEFLKVEWRRP